MYSKGNRWEEQLLSLTEHEALPKYVLVISLLFQWKPPFIHSDTVESMAREQGRLTLLCVKCRDTPNTCCLFARVYSGVTWLPVVRSQNAEMPNITYSHKHVHIHIRTAHISLHKSVKSIQTNRGSYPLSVSAGSDSLGPAPMLCETECQLDFIEATQLCVFLCFLTCEPVQLTCICSPFVHVHSIHFEGVSSSLWAVAQKSYVLQADNVPHTHSSWKTWKCWCGKT